MAILWDYGPNKLEVGDVHPPWVFHSLEVPAHGAMGPVTITIKTRDKSS